MIEDGYFKMRQQALKAFNKKTRNTLYYHLLKILLREHDCIILYSM
jgi:hypothetical protein